MRTFEIDTYVALNKVQAIYYSKSSRLFVTMKTIINDPAQLLNHRRISIQLVLIPGGSEDDSSALASEQK